ncbi:MAG: ABC transporter permease, partial [Natronospirillum sp.]
MTFNWVLVVLSLATLMVFWWSDFAHVQANRIVAGTGYGPVAALGPVAAFTGSGLLLVLVSCSVIGRRWQLWLALGLSTLLLMALPVGLSLFAQRYIEAAQPFARTGLGAGAWINLFLLSLIIIECQQRLAWPRACRPVPLLLVLCSLTWSVATGALDELGLLREYQSRDDQFARALGEHLQLVGGAVGISLVIGFTLAVQMLRRPGWQKPVLAVLSFFQTIPSLALFGLLIAPLAWLSAQWPWLQQFGIRGIGWAPAMLALIGYSLLPMVRNTWIALSEVPASVLESARGM